MENLKKKKVEENTVGKNKVSIPTLNLPINEVKIVVEEEEVEKVEISNILTRESLINDLKNTKIELPEKFKKKEKKESDKENQPHEENLQFFTRHLILFWMLFISIIKINIIPIFILLGGRIDWMILANS